ncbi:MAG: DinB family protein [Streptomyces sp.]|nr:DinB family protein [Streptomyces sp.]
MTGTDTLGQRTTGDAEVPAPAPGGERGDLLEVLAKHRHFLRFTARDLTDEQAALRTTVSELCLGGLIKHVTAVERNWAAFIVEGPSAMGDFDAMTPADFERWKDEFRMLPGDTLAGVLDAYAEVARRTDELVGTLPDLDADHPLPRAPWFEAQARWSARRVLMHIVAETAQHAGHADIIREALDGSKSMG